MKAKIVLMILLISLFVSGCNNNLTNSSQQTSSILNAETITSLSQNTIVDNPSKNKVTAEIDKNLIGKYIVKDDPQTYFEIMPDGKVEISLNAMDGYAKYTSDNIYLSAYYSDLPSENIYLSITLIDGQHTFPMNCAMSLNFESEGDKKYSEILSLTYYSSADIKFIKDK